MTAIVHRDVKPHNNAWNRALDRLRAEGADVEALLERAARALARHRHRPTTQTDWQRVAEAEAEFDRVLRCPSVFGTTATDYGATRLDASGPPTGATTLYIEPPEIPALPRPRNRHERRAAAARATR